MPTYEYLCEGCGHRLEEFQSITSEPLKKCPECNKKRLKRLIGGGAGFLFRGSGFHETDYRSKSYKQDAAKDKDGGKKDDAGASKGSKKSKPGTGGEKKGGGDKPATE